MRTKGETRADARSPGYRTFHGVPFSADGRFEGERSDVVVFGVPLDHGAGSRPGARYGPPAIRAATYIDGEVYHLALETEVFKHLKVVDAGDCDFDRAESLSMDAWLGIVADRARELVEATSCLVALGGDHSIMWPVLGSIVHRSGPVVLIHFDAHPDTWPGRDGLVTHATVVRRALESGFIRHGFQIGVRGYGPPRADMDWARDNGLEAWTIGDIDALGLDAVVERVISRTDGPAYLSVDVDVLDPSVAPGTGTPEPGGLTSRELLAAIRTIARNVELVGMDVVEVSPPYDHAEITATAGNRCVQEMLAGQARRVLDGATDPT
jgi:agmatinase